MTSAVTATAAGAVPAVTATRALIGLKLTLLRNGLRQSTARTVAFVAGGGLALLLAAGWALGLVALRGNEHAPDLVIVVFTLLGLGWAAFPLFFFGGDETLDPSRLAMLPLRPRALVRGLLAASLIGVGPLFTLLIGAGGMIALVRGPGALPAAVVAVPLTTAFCVSLARAVAAANTRLLTSRKGRDLALLSGLVVAVGIQVVNIGVQRLSRPDGLELLRPFADVTRWLPPALAAEAVRAAGEGSYTLAAGALLALALATLAVLWWWERSLYRLMVSPDASTLQPSAESGAGRTRAGRAGRLFPEGRTAATVVRVLKYAWRDPRAKAAWAAALGVGLLVPVAMAFQGAGSVYQACWAAGLLGLQMFNQFGVDGSSFWTVAATIPSRSDALAEVRARALAIAVVAVPYVAAVCVLTAVLTGEPEKLAEVLGLAFGLLGALIGLGAVASVLLPYSLPRSSNPMASAAPGQTGLAMLNVFGGMAGGAAACAPLIAAAVYLHTGDGHDWPWLLLPGGAGYGLLVAAAGLRVAAGRLLDRLPEVLAAVGKE